MNEQDTPDSVDYQIGAHSVDRDGIQYGDDQSDLIEFELETQTVFKRLAQDIYKSDEAGVREPLSNAVTAVQKAIDQYDLPTDEGVIQIQLYRGGNDENKLVIQDNGIGISEAELQEVVRVIGRSTVRDAGNLAGQFGMGFLAVFRLVGTDGGFTMHTHSRQEEEDPISGIWKSGGFAPDTESVLPGRFEDDEYGTRFEFVLKQDIDPDDVKHWIAKHARWARVNVIYQEFDSTKQIDNEDYGRTPFEATYDEAAPALTYDTPYFRAVCSPDADNRTVLLDVPIDRNHVGSTDAPWSIDIRLKNENSVVVDGPNEGLMPVADAEYDEMEASRQDEYIAKSTLEQDDIVMPGPVGTRETLASDDKFWDWLGRIFERTYRRQVLALCREITCADDLFDRDEPEFRMLMSAVGTLVDYGYNADIQERTTAIKTDFAALDVKMPEDVCRTMGVLNETVEYCPPDTSVRGHSLEHENIPAYKVTYTAHDDSDGDVYMGVTPQQLKADIVWDDDSANTVVIIDNSDMYPVFEELGWKKLTDITRATIDEYDVSDNIKDRFLANKTTRTNSGKDAPERQLTLHFGRRSTTKCKAEKLRSEFEQARDNEEYTAVIGRHTPQYLLLFPPHKEKKVSDNYWVSASHIATATCTKKVWDYLSDLPQVMYINDFIETTRQVEFYTSAGPQSVASLPDDKHLVIHALDEPWVFRFRDPDIMEEMKAFFAEEHAGWVDDAAPENIVYAPLTPEKLKHLYPLTDDLTVVSGDASCTTRGTYHSLSSDTLAFAWARLSDWRESAEFNLIADRLSRVSLQRGGYAHVETYAVLHDAGDQPFSEQVDLETHLDDYQESYSHVPLE